MQILHHPVAGSAPSRVPFCTTSTPRATWTRGHDGEVFERPMIQGHIKSFAAQFEWLEFYKIIKGLVTEEDVVFVIISEDVTQITEIVKKANGNVEAYDLIRNECLM